MNSGGNTREAKARLNMALNSLSSPPTPIFVKSQLGLMIERNCCLLQKYQINR